MLQLTWHSGPAWHERLNSDSSTTSIYSETGDRRRRHHRKSRNGCVRCRKRRVKCSEERPTCHGCRRMRLECQYSPVIRSAGRDDEGEEEGASTNSSSSPENVSSSETALSFPLAPLAAAWPPDMISLDADLLNFRPLVLSHAPQALDHFVRCDQPWLKHPTLQRIMQGSAASQVPSQAFLLHAVLAVAAAHLAAVSPEPRAYTTASLVHWQMFLRAYRCCLQGDMALQNIDAVFFASHLHSMLVPLHERAPDVGGADADAEPTWALPSWIRSMQGIKALWDMPNIITRLCSGVWRAWAQAVEPAHQRELGDSGAAAAAATAAAGAESMSPALAALRRYCRTLSDEERQACEERINVLAVVERRLPTQQGQNCLAWYITRAPAGYCKKLECADEMALLLLLYWCRLASRAEQWFLTQAACHESERIYAYLRRTRSNEAIAVLLDMVMEI